MELMEYLERDKENLLRKLDDAGSMEKAESVVREEFDRLLLQYNETCEEPLRREVAALMLQTAKLSSSFVDSVGETRIWENVSGNASPENTRKTVKPKVFLGVGAVSGICSVLCAVFSNTGNSFQITQVLAASVFMILAVLSGWFSGKISGKNHASGAKLPINYRTENKINSQHVYTCMHNMIFAADQDLDRLELPDHAQTKMIEAEAGGTPQTQLIELFSGQLEALYSEDGEFALDKIRDVKYYLHQRGIEIVEFDGSNKEMFDLMPSMKPGTFRPALVSNGKVLKRGLASGGR